MNGLWFEAGWITSRPLRGGKRSSVTTKVTAYGLHLPGGLRGNVYLERGIDGKYGKKWLVRTGHLLENEPDELFDSETEAMKECQNRLLGLAISAVTKLESLENEDAA